MSSRQQEKEQRRAARLEAERIAAAAAARQQRLRLAGGALLAVAAVAAIVVAIVAGGSKDSGSPNGPLSPNKTADIPAVAIPATKMTNLKAAAESAGCQLKDYPDYGNNHVTSIVNYKTNPPTSGNHNPTPASDGDYSGGASPAKENAVHALEHGRIEIQYRPGTPRRLIGQLITLFKQKAGPYQGEAYELLFENNTKMPYAVAATAWTHALLCPTANDKVFDAIRAFRIQYTLKAPELITSPE